MQYILGILYVNYIHGLHCSMGILSLQFIVQVSQFHLYFQSVCCIASESLYSYIEVMHYIYIYVKSDSNASDAHV